MKKIREKLYRTSIRKQIFAVMITLFIVMFAALYIILYNSMGAMLWERENQDMINQVNLTENALEDTYQYLPNVTRDWGAFDQTYHYMQGGFEEFLPYYLNDYPYKIYSLDFISILNVQGDITYERFYESSAANLNRSPLDLSLLYKQITPPTIGLLKNKSINLDNANEYSVSGFVKHNDTILYVSACPILRTDRTGPALGVIIFGRIVTQNNIDALSKNTDTKTRILDINQPHLSASQIQLLNNGDKLVNTTNQATLDGYAGLKDAFGNNTLLVSVSGSRHLYEEGIHNIQIVMGIVALCCCFIMFCVLTFLNLIVIKPIGLFVKDANEINLESDALSIQTVTKYKEFESLSVAINHMLSEIKTDRDIIQKTNATLFYNANYDLLTGLRNRVNCRNSLIKEIDAAKNNFSIVGVILLDLDKFKNINDTTDHTVGDRFIVAISERLQKVLGPNVLVGRFGGDEFMVIAGGIKDEYEFHLYVDMVLSFFSEPFVIGTKEVHISASIGTSTFPSDAKDVDTLVKNAEIAMYHAKKLGGNMYCRYENELHKVLQRKLYVENMIRSAINDNCNDFMAYFQPKALSESGNIISCEALIRWKTPEGIINPGEFIQLAEETGLIVPLSRWMIKEACRCNKIFEENGIEHIVSVNISSQVLLHNDFISMIQDAIQDTGMDITKLDIELTEETLLEDMPKVINTLKTLNELGITSSIDDFGTGYSSLSYLKKLPVDRIKIDRSFISGLSENNNGDKPIVNAIVAMGKTLNKLITAEGVEDSTQYAYLKSILCDEIQGYYVSKPLPWDEYIIFYHKWELDKIERLKEINELVY